MRRTRLSSLLSLCAGRNLEVFWVSGAEAKQWRSAGWVSGNGAPPRQVDSGSSQFRAGWYWWSCCPGCLPDSDPMGPFTSPTRAAEDALGDDF